MSTPVIKPSLNFDPSAHGTADLEMARKTAFKQKIDLTKNGREWIAQFFSDMEDARAAIAAKYASLKDAPGAPIGTLQVGQGNDLGFYQMYQQGAIYSRRDLGAFWVHGAIYDKYRELGGEGSFLGWPVSDESPAPDNVGRFSNFERGCIYWRAELGAHEIHGAILERWQQLGQTSFGYPVTDEVPCLDNVGRFNNFRAFGSGGTADASIYWNPQIGAREVHGAIREKWASLGYETSYLGYPVTDETDWLERAGGRLSRFERGIIVWSSIGGANDLPDSRVIDSGSLTTAAALAASFQWVINSDGTFKYSGSFHDSGAIGYDVVLISAFDFQDAAGRVCFAPIIERHVGGTTTIIGPGRDRTWDVVGFNSYIRENWDPLQGAGVHHDLKTDTPVADVIQAVLVGLPVLAFVALVSAIVYLFVNGDLKACKGQYSTYHDPISGDQKVQFSFPIKTRNDPCPEDPGGQQ